METTTVAALVAEPAKHAARGGAATLAVLALLANAMKNRNALVQLLLLRWKRAAAALSVTLPTRSITAVSVFVATYRFVHRLELRLAKRRAHFHAPHSSSRSSKHAGAPSPASVASKDSSSSSRSRHAALAASVLGVLCIHPESRAAIISLLATNTASLAFRNYLLEHPELAHLAPLELLVFMWSGGWIMYSAFFHPESYEPSHLKLIMKYTLVSPAGAAHMQTQYRAGLNPNTCTLRHPGRECTEYLFPGFMKRVVALGYRVYLPVHLTSWVLALRHAKVRAMPAPELLVKFLTKLTRSSAYFIGFIGFGWTASCYSRALGDRSLAWRKLQFALCGSLPALSILFEAPARRRPIGVILVSYALVSLCAVAVRSVPLLRLLRAGPMRTLLDVALFTGAVSYTLPEMLRGNSLLRCVLLGGGGKSPSPARASSSSNSMGKDDPRSDTKRAGRSNR